MQPYPPRLTAVLAILVGFLYFSAASPQPSPSDWQVTNFVRTIELGGTVHVQSDVHVLRPPPGTSEPSESDPGRKYYFALSQHDSSSLSAVECTAKFGAGIKPSQRAILNVTNEGPWDLLLDSFLSSDNVSASVRPQLFSVKVPSSFQRKVRDDTELPDVTLTITSTILFGAEPLPKSVGQSESQSLVWTGEAEPLGVYDLQKARVKVKAPQPKILSYNTSPDLPSDQVTKSGSIITFGPFDKLSAIRPEEKVQVTKATVHYAYDSPVITVVEAQREVRISHWRNYMSFKDSLWVKNDGASLKGHFSRIQHQMQSFLNQASSHVLSDLVMHLPPGSDDAYFVDDSGNVSTSHFRPSPPSPQHIGIPTHLLSASKASVMELRPRYPLLGGWNYSFSVGWKLRMSDGWLENDGSGHYQVKIPFLTPMTDVAVREANTRVILPEGASNIVVKTPFTIDSQSQSKLWGFLDTNGRPVVNLYKKLCSDRHGGLITIEYDLSPLDQFRKVLIALALVATTAATMGLVSKIDVRIKG